MVSYALEPFVLIIGKNNFTNSILLRLLESETGFCCSACTALNRLRENGLQRNGYDAFVLLWDYENEGLDQFWTEFQGEGKLWQDKCKIAVFNAPVESDLGLYLLRNGGHGIFFKKDSPDILIKGIKELVNGGLWIPRDIANKYISKTRRGGTGNKTDLITRREKDILRMLPSGVSNEEIAGTLGISPHTVRTHLSNIYGKLELTNRFQAALWATEHL